jgi:hypothetical protein
MKKINFFKKQTLMKTHLVMKIIYQKKNRLLKKTLFLNKLNNTVSPSFFLKELPLKNHFIFSPNPTKSEYFAIELLNTPNLTLLLSFLLF